MQINSLSVNNTISIAKHISKSLKKGDIICLFGNLGSGKTVFVKGLALGLGIKKDYVTSPTFVLLAQYSGNKLSLNHFDLYRLDEVKDILNLGYEEYLYSDSVNVIEWADRLDCLMPKEYLKVNLSIKGENKRLIEFTAHGERYKELIHVIGSRL